MIFKAYDVRLLHFSPTFDTDEDFKLVQAINEMLINELGYPTFVLIQNGITLFSLDKFSKLVLDHSSVSPLDYTKIVRSFRTIPLFKTSEIGKNYFINRKPVRGKILLDTVTSMLTLGYRQGFMVAGELSPRYYTVSPPRIRHTFNAFIRDGGTIAYYRNALTKVLGHVYNEGVKKDFVKESIIDDFSNTLMWSIPRFEDTSTALRLWYEGGKGDLSVVVERFKEEYNLNLYIGGVYVVNLDNPFIVKTLKTIELILINSGLISMPIQPLIDQILRLSDSPFETLTKAELVDIINAGISVDYKFQISGDSTLGYLIHRRRE